MNYIAPEMLCNRRVGRSADVWSLGCILHRMLFNENVYVIQNVAAKMLAISGACPRRRRRRRRRRIQSSERGARIEKRVGEQLRDRGARLGLLLQTRLERVDRARDVAALLREVDLVVVCRRRAE